MLRRQWCDDTKQSTPKAGHATGCTSDWRREDLGCPAVENGVEHGLEEVFHDVQSNVGRLVVDGTEDEDASSHEPRGYHHGVFAANQRHAVHERSQNDTDDARKVDVDVASVGEFERQTDGAIL